jgi:hypothetical protein
MEVVGSTPTQSIFIYEVTTALIRLVLDILKKYYAVRNKTLSLDTLKNVLLQLESVGLLRLEQDKGIGDVQSFAPLCPAIYLPSPGGAEGD